MDNEPILEIDADGHKLWKLNGKYHRVDGPAIELTDGEKSWWLDGKLHREDGPAYEGADGDKEWWLNDIGYEFDKWLEENNYLSEEEKVMLKLIHG
jgi:hypothetical protein